MSNIKVQLRAGARRPVDLSHDVGEGHVS